MQQLVRELGASSLPPINVADLRKRTHLRQGENYYLICSEWYEALLSSFQAEEVSSEAGHESGPGPIDNSKLIAPGGCSGLRFDLLEDEDYRILTKDMWEQLQGWYGGGPPIIRPAAWDPIVEYCVLLYGLKVEVHSDRSRNRSPQEIYEWPSTLTGDFKRRLCQRMGVRCDQMEIWAWFAGSHQNTLRCLEESLFETLGENQIHMCHRFELKARLLTNNS